MIEFIAPIDADTSPTGRHVEVASSQRDRPRVAVVLGPRGRSDGRGSECLWMGRAEWDGFVAAVKRGDFDQV